MQNMRSMLRNTLGRSLQGIASEDRLSAAWTVVCGPAMAQRGQVVGYEDETVFVHVTDSLWLQQMLSMRPVLERELAAAAGLPVRTIHFQLRKVR